MKDIPKTIINHLQNPATSQVQMWPLVTRDPKMFLLLVFLLCPYHSHEVVDLLSRVVIGDVMWWCVTTLPRKQPDLCSMWCQKTKIKYSMCMHCRTQAISFLRMHLPPIIPLVSWAFAAPCTLCSVSFHSLSTRDPLYPLSPHHLSFSDLGMRSGLFRGHEIVGCKTFMFQRRTPYNAVGNNPKCRLIGSYGNPGTSRS